MRLLQATCIIKHNAEPLPRARQGTLCDAVNGRAAWRPPARNPSQLLKIVVCRGADGDILAKAAVRQFGAQRRPAFDARRRRNTVSLFSVSVSK